MARQKTKPATAAAAKQPVEAVAKPVTAPAAGTDLPKPPAETDAGQPPVTEPVGPAELAAQQGNALHQGGLVIGNGAAAISPGAVAVISAIASQAVEGVKALHEAMVNVLTITVVGPAKGRWRAGRHFTPEPTVIPLTDLTEDQVAALDADPELTVIAND